jgi:salicylate hydroxylase
MKVVIVGAGVAGSILAYILQQTPGIEARCFEQVGAGEQSDAGTGLNIGPNAVKTLAAHVPDLYDAVLGVSVLWRNWRISLTDGTVLMDLPLAQVADNPGIRLRWSELYRVLRKAAAQRIRFDTKIIACGRSAREPGKLFFEARSNGNRIAMEDVDLLVACDGRYSQVRKDFAGLAGVRQVGVCIFRLLVPDDSGGLIDDYEQWFNGPNRLLAFRVPERAWSDMVYIAGSFPIPAGADIPESAKSTAALRAAYTPASGAPSPACRWMIETMCARLADIHWARVQEVEPLFADPTGHVLFLGDAAHGMVPTLGQGATQAIEDACLAGSQIRAHWLAARRAKAALDVPSLVAAIAQKRAERVRFVMEFSLEATDTMLAGADPVGGTKKKLERAFQEKLRRLYCDAPVVI